MKTRKNQLLLTLALVSIFFSGCKDEQEIVSLPVVQTLEITQITPTTASSGGVITDDGGDLVIERGICWDVNPHPTNALLTKSLEGQDKGTFVSELTNLLPNQQYYLRAYATNRVGTSYGSEISFFTQPNNVIIYNEDGRTVKYGDPFPIALDLSDDGRVDFTVFVELTANSQYERLYAGINPIGDNQIKSGPAIDENFISMGFLVAETLGSTIDAGLEGNQRWTSDHSALLIRNTSTGGQIFYEGDWADSKQIVGIQHHVNGSVYFGWLRIEFDKTTEVVTLIDYAHNSTANLPIIAGAIEAD